MDWAIEYFQGLPEVVGAEEVRMAGAWAAKPQRRYASPKQAGTGEGPFIETIDWRWDGAFEGASALAGIVLLAVDRRLFWVKSQPPTERPVVSVSAHGWADATRSVSLTGSFHGGCLPSVPVEIGDEPPTACTMGNPRARVGVPHVVAQVQGVVLAVLLLPASAVQVGRNRLWHLRAGIATGLPRRPHDLLTRGRSGMIDLPA
jgi:hypothetical protein